MTRLGIIGTGDIFDRYITGLRRFPQLELIRCADIDVGRAEEAADRAGGIESGPPEELLGDDSIEIAIVLTPPTAHASVVAAALDAGKHVYVEKPLAATVAEGVELVRRAGSANLALASAPDTFLGSACQTAREVIDSGEIGDVYGAAAFMTHNHSETRHPDPTFNFKPGGGPLLDLGPYYLTQLVNCLGPVAEVAGMTRIGHPQRFVTAPNRRVDVIDVEVATHTTATLRFESGVIATLMMSFDVWTRNLPFMEIYGTRGQVQLPDPNTFDGGVQIRWNDDNQWRYVPPVVPPLAGPARRDQLLRGVGVVDLAASIGRRAPRASSEMALHVLEVLTAVDASSETHSVLTVASTCSRPEPLTPAEVAAFISDHPTKGT